MSLNSDYSYFQTATQHHRELLAEAANDRLAREATAGRTPWWRRWAGGSGPTASQVRTQGEGIRTTRHGIAHSHSH